MLVLSRKPGQKIVIPQCGITVAVLSVSGKRATLGIAAPDQIAIHRAEVVKTQEGLLDEGQTPSEASQAAEFG